MKPEQIKKIKSVLEFAMMTIFFVAIFFVFRFVIVGEKGYYHSDCTDTILWAQAAYDGGALMNPDFNYAGLMPFGGQLIMLPFVAMFGVSMKAQIMGMAVFFILFVATLILMFRMLGFSFNWTIGSTAAIVLMASASEKLREIFWGHIIYYSLGLLFLMIGFSIVLKIIKNEEKEMSIKRRCIAYIILLVWTTLCSMNGVQSMTTFTFPVIAALIAERFFDFETKLIEKKNLKRMIIVGVLFVGVVIGVILGSLAIGDIKAGYADGYSKFSDFSEWVTNFLNFFPQLFRLAGVQLKSDMKIYTFKGVLNLLRIIASLVIVFVPIIMLFMYKRIKETSYKLLLIIHHVLSALIMLGWTFGVLSTAEWRLSPLYVSGALVCIMFVKWAIENLKIKRMLVLVIVPVMIFVLIIVREMVLLDKQSDNNKELTEITEFLEEKNLEYGYSTFWQANIITLLSDSKVKVRDIDINENGFYKRYYQSNINWYENAKGYDKYFILLNDWEYDTYYVQNSIVPAPEEMYECGDYKVFVYSYNLFSE